MIVTRWQDYVEIEYEIDVAELVRYQNKWGGAQVDSNAIAEVESNYTSICASGEAFSSNYTKQYVEQASASGDRAIVWYPTMRMMRPIFTQPEREMRPTTIIFIPRATSPIPGWGTVAV